MHIKFYESKTIKGFFESYHRNIAKAKSITSPKSINFANRNAYSYEMLEAKGYSTPEGSVSFEPGVTKNLKLIEVESKSGILNIIYEQNETMEQILSSFRFD